MPQLVWLVTGASAGVGEEIARAALSRGDQVIATSRGSVDRMKALKDAGATTMSLDVTANQAEIDKTIQDAIKVHGRIDVVAPNAGLSGGAFVETITEEIFMKLLDVNFFGVTRVVGSLLPHFRARRCGTIAFTNSVYSQASTWTCAPYAASKHAVAAYAKTIAVELGSFNVKPILFEMGYYRTEIMSKSKFYALSSDEDYKPAMEMIDGFVKSAPIWPGDPTKCGKTIVQTVHDEGRKSMFVPLGSDGLETMRAYAKALLAACEENEEKARSTDLDEPKQGFFAQTPHYFTLI